MELESNHLDSQSNCQAEELTKFRSMRNIFSTFDENHFLALTLLCRKINDEETQREIDLIRSESDAFRLIHQVKHPAHDPNQFPINPLNGLRLMAKRRMRMVNNLQRFGE